MKIQRRQLVRLAMFCAIGLGCGVLMANTLSVPVRGSSERYALEFTDVEGLTPGNPVTMAGVRVGRVDSIEFTGSEGGRAIALVGIEVEADHPLPADVTAAVRYGDMLGARFVSLAGGGDAAEPIEPGALIPLSRTTPPTDLTALMNGFRPLFDALEPDQVNTLTRSFVETFSGQGQAVADLLAHIAEMSSGLVAQQEIFSQLVGNMAQLLSSVDSRQPELERFLTGLGALSSTVLGDNDQLIALLDEGNSVVTTLAGSMARTNGEFSRSVTDLKSVTDTWIAHTEEFDRFVANLPQFADGVNRIGSYGGFISLYLCNFTLKAGELEANIFGPTHSPVCS
ncbi:MCE family protein [Rhodococcus triatomae]|uniref:Phospholipid/cholesterol/gamma-HCH transport system substrate-binding protein n=1 Tax=Rhodococcus triatomae TaxID=300028 RepID=A0A1G8RDH4_9NOCA|nr:MlaD family protein [Rhodococcus triatomae]QNG19646.1 MCE family protein [Rhodococcus triatomae]QNG24439.1 MCE family protein [Rhodococcus triatomae]SDJ14971.1 phospholipid/cholesterol/gamma-HCH transport system substrate-binding protein [Rhodococcus triatomae]